MEEMDCRGLQEFCARLDGGESEEIALATLEFARECNFGISGRLKTAEASLRCGKIPRGRKGAANREAVEALATIVSTGGDAGAVLDALEAVSKIPGVTTQ